MKFQHMRIARPVSNLQLSLEIYAQGLGMKELGSFTNHQGFSGYMLGYEGTSWHLEFTQFDGHPLSPSPTDEDLLVLYIPEKNEWEFTCATMQQAGFTKVPSFNPYWDIAGTTFVDHDGYRVVLQNNNWG
ncbi:VOC family protein [Rouxiella sp. T17]|uniref:VOC family protein n=1 Tax=Rouxiella sp. T17 TaxID=3085684 RepID=UPI002FCB0FD2